MKTVAKVLFALFVLVGALAGTVALLGSQAEPLPAVDPSMLITMPDGTSLPLEAFVAQVAEEDDAARVAPPPETPEPPQRSPRVDRDVDIEVFLEDLAREAAERRRNRPGLLGHADRLLDDGKVDEALAVLRSIGPDDRSYARAQRKIGWDIMTKAKGQPARGIAYVNRCLTERPLDDNAWEDAVRVWSRTLGVPVN